MFKKERRFMISLSDERNAKVTIAPPKYARHVTIYFLGVSVNPVSIYLIREHHNLKILKLS